MNEIWYKIKQNRSKDIERRLLHIHMPLFYIVGKPMTSCIILKKGKLLQNKIEPIPFIILRSGQSFQIHEGFTQMCSTQTQ